MAYNPNIPNPGDLISVSQGQLKNNFQAIKTLIDVNHVDFANPGDMGKHIFVTFTDQTGTPPVATGTDINVYNAVDPNTGFQELWFQTSLGLNIPFTSALQTSSTNGWSFLPSGLMIQWGQFATNTFTFPRAFPTNCFVVFLTSIVGGNILNVISKNATGATIGSTVSNSGYFFAIGN